MESESRIGPGAAVVTGGNTKPSEAPTRSKFTIITPVYNEAAGLSNYENGITDVLLPLSEYDFEILLIDDGSTDGSWEIIKDICLKNDSFQGLRLSRNFGAHTAISAGFAHASGDAVVILACDLQDPPTVVPHFIDRWKLGAKIVWGKRKSRQDGVHRALASEIFTKLLQRYAMPRGSKFATGSFLLADRKVVDCFNQFREHNRITFALIAWTGFDQAVVEYDRVSRKIGESKWHFSALLKAMYDAFIGFSLLPIRLITLLGLSVFLVSLALLAYIAGSWLWGNPLAGWTSLMMLSTFFFGVQFLMMGVIGEYLYRIHIEATGRPLYFISGTTLEKDTHARGG